MGDNLNNDGIMHCIEHIEQRLRGIVPQRNPLGTGKAHAAWMVEEMKLAIQSAKNEIDLPWQEDVLNRWLGHVLCIMIYERMATLDENRALVRGAYDAQAQLASA